MENDKVLIEKDDLFCIDDLENKSIESLKSLENDLRKKLQCLGGDDCNMKEEIRVDSSIQMDKKGGSGERDIRVEMHNFDVSNSKNRAIHIDSNEGNNVVFAEDIKVQFFVQSPLKRVKPESQVKTFSVKTPSKDSCPGMEIQIENEKFIPSTQQESDKELIKALRSLGKRLQIKCNNLEKDNKSKTSKIEDMTKAIDQLKSANNEDSLKNIPPDPEKKRLAKELQTRIERNKQLCLLGRQLQEKVRDLEDKIKSKDESINFLTDQVEYYIDNDHKVSKTIDSINANSDKILKEKQTLKDEISTKDALHVSMSSLIKRLKDKCRNLEDNLKNKDSCIVELNDKIKSLEEELDQKKDEEAEYAESFEIELEKVKNRYNAEIKDLTKDKVLNIAIVDELKITNEGLLSKLDIQMSKCEASNLSNSKLEKELSQVNTQLKRKEVEIRVLSATSKSEAELRKITEGNYQSSLLTNLDLQKCNDACKSRLRKLLIVGRKLKERLERTVTKARENKMRDMSYTILVLNTKVTDLEDEVKNLKAKLEALKVSNVNVVMKTKYNKLRIVGRYFRHKYFQLLTELNENKSKAIIIDKCVEFTYSFCNPLDISCFEESSNLKYSDIESKDDIPSDVESRSMESCDVELSYAKSCNFKTINVDPENVVPSNVVQSTVEPSNVGLSNADPSNIVTINVVPGNDEYLDIDCSNVKPSYVRSTDDNSTDFKSTADESTADEPTDEESAGVKSSPEQEVRNEGHYCFNKPLDIGCAEESDQMDGDVKKYSFTNPLDIHCFIKSDEEDKLEGLTFIFSNPQELQNISCHKPFNRPLSSIQFDFSTPLILENITNDQSSDVNSLDATITKPNKVQFQSPSRIFGQVIHLSRDEETDMSLGKGSNKTDNSEWMRNKNLVPVMFNFQSPVRISVEDLDSSDDGDCFDLLNEEEPGIKVADDRSREDIPGRDDRCYLKRSISEDHPVITNKLQKVASNENDSGFVEYQD